MRSYKDTLIPTKGMKMKKRSREKYRETEINPSTRNFHQQTIRSLPVRQTCAVLTNMINLRGVLNSLTWAGYDVRYTVARERKQG